MDYQDPRAELKRLADEFAAAVHNVAQFPDAPSANAARNALFDAIDALAASVPAQPAEPCPRCDGSGSITVPSDNGPDAYDVNEVCPHCEGDGSLESAYRGVLKELEIQRAETLKQHAKWWGIANVKAKREEFLLEVGESDARWLDPIGYWKEYTRQRSTVPAFWYADDGGSMLALFRGESEWRDFCEQTAPLQSGPLYAAPVSQEVAQPVVPAGWQPIEAAPKDGRTLLLGYPNRAGKWRTVRGQWMSADYIAEYWEDPDLGGPGWFETSEEADDVPNCWPISPTHWMPLPAAPGAAAPTLPQAAAQEAPAAEELTEAQCDEFRRLNCSFNDMVRAIHEAGWKAGYKHGAWAATPAAQEAPAEVARDAARWRYVTEHRLLNEVTLAEHFGGSRLQDFGASIDLALAPTVTEEKR